MKNGLADFEHDGSLYPVTIKRATGCSHISLRFDPVIHDIRLTVPARASKRQLKACLDEHTDWLAARIDQRLKPVPFSPGMEIPIEDMAHILRHDDRPRRDRPPGIWRREDEILWLTGQAEHFDRRCREAFRDMAGEKARLYIDEYCDALGEASGKITMRDTGTRWGSCTAAGDFNLSWRLIFAPPVIFRYVAAHEAAHLVHRNHSPAFWQLVGELDPTYKTAKSWLKNHGHDLFRYGAESLGRPANQ